MSDIERTSSQRASSMCSIVVLSGLQRRSSYKSFHKNCRTLMAATGTASARSVR